MSLDVAALLLQLKMDFSTGSDAAVGLLTAVVPGVPPAVPTALAALAGTMARLGEDSSNTVSATISLRLMLRAARRAAAYPEDFYEIVAAGIMLRFMPAAARAAVGDLLAQAGIRAVAGEKEAMVDIFVADGHLHMGGISAPLAVPKSPELVPDVVFFEIPSHTLVLQSMLKMSYPKST